MPTPALLAALPTLERAQELTRALAALDAVMSEDWDLRYYSFDPVWDDGAQMASMRNGQGDDWFCWFGAPGAAIVGLDHESPMSRPRALWPGLLDGVPEAFRKPVLEEPAFKVSESTFVIWRGPDDRAWQSGSIQLPDGPDPDGAVSLLALLTRDDPAAYVDFASEYYEQEIDREAVAQVYRTTPLNASMVASLNPLRAWEAARDEVAALTFPVA